MHRSDPMSMFISALFRLSLQEFSGLSVVPSVYPSLYVAWSGNKSSSAASFVPEFSTDREIDDNTTDHAGYLLKIEPLPPDRLGLAEALCSDRPRLLL